MPSNYPSSGIIQPHQTAFNNFSAGYADIPMDATWKSLSPPIFIEATGKMFFVSVGATAANTGGTGPSYRLMFAAFQDGVDLHGETQFEIITSSTSYYQTGMMSSMIEGSPPGDTHTFELKVMSPGGSVAIKEANMTVLAFK